MSGRPTFTFPFWIVLSLLVLGGSGVIAAQWQRGMLLRMKLEQGRLEAEELGRIKTENERLKATEISPSELAALRADHAAVQRLRAELEALKNSTPTVGP